MDDCKDVHFTTDKQKMERLIDNILSNAIKYTNKATRIRITLDETHLSIEDEGKGMSKEELDKIFTRYLRFDKSQGEFGIGYSVKKITLFILICAFLNASEFDKNCLNCHGGDFKFHVIMKKYTLKYSSEEKIKEAMFWYLKEPAAEKSILPAEYIKRFGIKEKSNLDDETLIKMIDIYYKKFGLQPKLY